MGGNSTFVCATCSREHDLDEISFGIDRPLQWDHLTDAEREKSELGQEQCIIESAQGKSFYVRACLEIPVKGTDRTFTWGVWVSLSEKSFLEMSDHWEDPDRPKYGPYFGWFCTKLPGYADTAFLKSRVHQRNVGERPRIELEPTDHPLAIHQREGIEEPSLRERVIRLLHP